MTIAARLARLRRDRRGNMLMIFAFALVPITFATGMGVDYAAAMRLQTKVNAVADAASLTAVTSSVMKQNKDNACVAARIMFLNQYSSAGLQMDPSLSSNLKITLTDTLTDGSAPTPYTCPASIVPSTAPAPAISKRIATVTWGGESMNSFGGILGLATLHVGGNATAQAALMPYIDVHMVLDTSQSMGLAASDADATALWNRTTQYNGEGCTFGCHVPSPGHTYANEALANNPAFGTPIKLRVNVLRDATTSMIQTAINAQGTQNTYRFGLYRIGRTLSTLTPLTSNLSNVQTTASTLTLGDNDSSGVGDTNLIDTMARMYGNIPIHGDGATQSAARAFMFIVTDGVTDLRNDQADASDPGGNHNGCTYNHCTKPIDPATCQRYKDANITVGIVYTTYLPVKANPLDASSTALRPEYTNLIQHFSWLGYSSPNPSNNSADIAPALQACASSGWYFEASDATTIHAAMQRLFAQAAQSAALTH